MRVAIVHDYLTQRGGAERVVLSLMRAFPGSELVASLYDPAGTFPEFMTEQIRTLPLNRFRPFRTDHRRSLPLLAPAFDRTTVDADVVICSSSGWSHGARVSGKKIVYCHSPARWLYQTERYLGESARISRAAVGALRPWLERWDKRAASTADAYVVHSRAVRDHVRDVYGIDASVLPPAPAPIVGGEAVPLVGVAPGYYLAIARLLPYKNVGAIVDAFNQLPSERLVVVGSGPEEDELRRRAPKNVRFAGRVTDAEMRWLYQNSVGTVAASYEDFGLTPLEAAAFGKPSATLRFGGFLDTILEGITGVYFDEPTPDAIAHAVGLLCAAQWDSDAIRQHAEYFSETNFVRRWRAFVESVR